MDTTLPIVDSHHHIWNLADLPWLNGPPVPRIFGAYDGVRRDYSIEEYRRDIASSNVVKSVYVQTNWGPGEAEKREVAWVQSIADRHGFPHAIVGFADLEDDACARVLDAYLSCRNFRGVRQQLHWHENPQYRFASRPDMIRSSKWQNGLRQVADRGLLFELQVFPKQMAECIDVIKAFPGLTFVLTHAGMLEETSAQNLAIWRSGMRALAACPNVVVKLTGLGTFVHRCELALWKPVIDETVAIFGANRCMFGSNFPIESLWTTYAQLVSVVRAIIAEMPLQDQKAILHDTAARVYHLA